MKNLNDKGKADAQQPRKTYSAQELATMYIYNREAFLSLNLKEQTHDWDFDYLGDFCYYLRTPDLMEEGRLMLYWKWEEEEGIFTSVSSYKNLESRLRYEKFKKDLENATDFAQQKLAHEAFDLYTITNKEYKTDLTEVPPSPLTAPEADTIVPVFTESSPLSEAPPVEEVEKANVPQFHLDDLDQETRKLLNIYDDETYTLFVNAMRGPVKKWVEGEKLQLWNLVKAVCHSNSIVKRKGKRIISIDNFCKLLEAIIPGISDQRSNMKQFKLANNKDFVKLTKNPSANLAKNEYFDSLTDAKEVKRMLHAVIARVPDLDDKKGL